MKKREDLLSLLVHETTRIVVSNIRGAVETSGIHPNHPNYYEPSTQTLLDKEHVQDLLDATLLAC